MGFYHSAGSEEDVVHQGSPILHLAYVVLLLRCFFNHTKPSKVILDHIRIHED